MVSYTTPMGTSEIGIIWKNAEQKQEVQRYADAMGISVNRFIENCIIFNLEREKIRNVRSTRTDKKKTSRKR